MKDTLTIIVTYNRMNLLNECLCALINQSYKCDILVVDNNSTDETKGIVDKNTIYAKEKNINILYKNTGINLGGAGGYNYGIKYACNLNYDYFYIMDDDCIVNEKSLEKLHDANIKLNDNWSFLSSKVLWTDGSICKTNVQRRKVARMIKDFTIELVNVDYASFVSLFIKKQDVIKVGLPIKDFFIWSDDLEYTRRLSLNCGKGYLVNDSIVIHKCAQNIGVDISRDTADRIDRYKYIYRNDVFVFKREGISGIIYLIVRYFYHIFKILVSRKEIFKKISIMTKGYVDGVRFNPTIEQMRMYQYTVM